MTPRELKRRLRAVISTLRNVNARNDKATAHLRDELARAKQARACGHITLRRPDWPCPDPRCSGPQSTLKLLEPVGQAELLMNAPIPTLAQEYLQIGLLRRERLIINGEAFWAWREA